MTTYNELLQTKSDLIAESRGILSRADKEGRDLTDDEKTRDDNIHAQLAQAAPYLARHERTMAAERLAVAVPDKNMQAAARGRESMTRIEGVRNLIDDDPRRGFASIAEFGRAIRAAYSPNGVVDERLRVLAAPSNVHIEVNSDEGLMVPPQFRAEIFDAVMEYSSLLGVVDPEPTSGNSVEYLRDTSTPWGATGVQAKWRSEESLMVGTRLTTDPSSLRLHELYAFVTASGELLQDAPRLSNRLTKKAGEAIAYKIDDAIVNGTGAGQPQGWFGSSALVSVAKESGQAGDTVLAANIGKMYSRLIEPQNGIWFINQDVMPQLFTMVIGSQPVWFPPNASIQNAPTGGFLLGRPVQMLEACQTLGDKGDIQFVNPRGYYAVIKNTMPEFASSMHLYFDYNLEAFRWIFRLGGQPFLAAPISPAKGTSTRSHFVTLDARA